MEKTLLFAQIAQLVNHLGTLVPGSQDGVQMMLEGLKKVQTSMMASSAPQATAAPPL